jgi:HEPN domain-containing protein
VATRELEYAQPAFHTVCFLCQTAAEKFLKGYLITQGWRLQRTHDIVALLQMCTEYSPDWSTLITEGAILNEYITAGRYPSDIVFERIGRPEALEALRAVERIAECVRTHTNKR